MAEEFAVLQAVSSVTRSADRRRWDLLRATLADRVVLDYGVPGLLTPDEIVDRWRPFLSAFDATDHDVHDCRVEFVEPDTAWVTSGFRAVHRIAGAAGGDLWALTGRYEHEARRTDRGWRVTRMRMIPYQSTGNRALPDLARARAKLPEPTPPAYRVEHLRFEVHGTPIAGLLHVPPDVSGAGRLPAVAVMGSWTTVKEQMAGEYARRLVAAGFAALTFDFRGFGESGGAPRHMESPADKVEDIRAAVGALASHPAIDPERIGLVGVCAGSGYAGAEAAGDPRVRSVVMIAPWLHDAALVEAVYGGREVYGGKGASALAAAGRAARARYEKEGVVDYVPGASTTDPRAAMYWPDPGVLDYYLNISRGGIPQWGNRFAVLSWPQWLAFDAMESAPALRVPTLMVHSEQGAIPDGARRYAAAMPVEPRLVWTSGTQFHFYDDPATIDYAVGQAVAHLRETLRAGGNGPGSIAARVDLEEPRSSHR